MTKVKNKPSKNTLNTLEGVTSQNSANGSTVVVNKEEVIEFKMPLGRPADPNSARQKQIQQHNEYVAAMKEKFGEDWTPKQGRPANPNSANYKKKQELEQRKADPNYVAKRGRPVVEGSPRQIKLAQQAARRDAYIAAQKAEQ